MDLLLRRHNLLLYWLFNILLLAVFQFIYLQLLLLLWYLLNLNILNLTLSPTITHQKKSPMRSKSFNCRRRRGRNGPYLLQEDTIATITHQQSQILHLCIATQEFLRSLRECSAVWAGLDVRAKNPP